MAGEDSAVIERELLENNGAARAALPRPSVRPSVCGLLQCIHTLKEEKGKTSGVPSICKSKVSRLLDDVL